MNLDELRSVRDDERESGTLQPLRPTFYQEAREFIGELETERDSLAAECSNPFENPEVIQLTDRLTAANEVLESIYENRVAKLLTHASTVAAGSSEDPPGLTSEEQALYETMVQAIRSTKAAALSGETSDDGSPVDSEHASESNEPVPETPPSSEPEEEPAGEEFDRQTLRMLDDVGTILGVDEREYDLARGDVVSLPVENAKALLERDVAEAIEGLDT